MQDVNDTPPYFHRIMERIQALGLVEAHVSMQAFNHGSGIKNMRKGTKSPGIENFLKLAPILKTSPAYLAFGSGEDLSMAPQRSVPVLLPVIGDVAAGVWIEAEAHTDASAAENATLCAHPRWPAGCQYALVSRGTSINRVTPEGSLLACVDTRAIHYQAQDGDLIVVERREAGRIERSAKRFRRTAEGCELWPDSTDAKWSRPLVLFGDSTRDEGITIEVVGLIYAWLAPIQAVQPWIKF